MGFWTDKQLLGPNPDDNESRRSSPDKNSVTEEVESGRYVIIVGQRHLSVSGMVDERGFEPPASSLRTVGKIS